LYTRGGYIFNTEKSYYIWCNKDYYRYLRGVVTSKELPSVLYRVYKDCGFNKESTVRLLQGSVYYIYKYLGEHYITPVNEDTLYNLLGSSYKGVRFTYTKQYHTRHTDTKWRNSHYVDKLRLYSKLSTCGYSYRGKQRDSGKYYEYNWIGYDGACSRRSTGWKNSKKRHQWE